MDAYNEATKFSEMFEEADRSRRVWMQEYFNINRFSNAYQREANILADALQYAMNHLDGVDAHLTKALHDKRNEAAKVRLDAVKPITRVNLDDVRESFLAIAKTEGMDITTSGGKFTNPFTKRFYSLYAMGAVVGFEHARNHDTLPVEPEPINYVELMADIKPKRRLLLDDEPAPAPKRRLLMED